MSDSTKTQFEHNRNSVAPKHTAGQWAVDLHGRRRSARDLLHYIVVDAHHSAKMLIRLNNQQFLLGAGRINGDRDAAVASEAVKMGRCTATTKENHSLALALLPIDLQAEGSKDFAVSRDDDGKGT